MAKRDTRSAHVEKYVQGWTSEELEDVAHMIDTATAYLWDGKGKCKRTAGRFVCTAIGDAYSMDDYQKKTYEKATGLIRKLLTRTNGYRCHTVFDYLASEKGCHIYASGVTDRQMQKYRLAWMRAMIRELRALATARRCKRLA